MTRTTPVGWPANRPADENHGHSPRPVGWQGLSSDVVEVAGGDAGVETVNRKALAAEADSNGDDVHVSRETVAVLDPQSTASSPERDVYDTPLAQKTAEVMGYDILLGGAIVPRAPRPVSRVQAESTPDEAVSDGPGVGDAATTVSDAPNDERAETHHDAEEAPRSRDIPDASRPKAGTQKSTGGAYVPRHQADPAADPRSGAEVPLSIEADPALAARSPLPSRKARRAGRPRVPSFDKVTQADWQVGSQRDDDIPTIVDADDAPDSSTTNRNTNSDAAETGAQVQAGVHDDSRPGQVAYTRSEQLPRPSHPRILTVANQKGGVGKTTTTVNVAAALAQGGLKVLVIDIDPQGNASTALSVEHHPDVDSVYDVIVEGTPIADVMHECPDIPGLWCAPATIDLAGAEIELVSLVARESRLHRAIMTQLNDMAESERFDYVFIDCPPSLGLLTVNAFVAADEVFIPIQCEYYALEGLSQLLKNIEMIKVHLNPGLHVSTILLTMYDGRTKLAHQVADEVRTHFPDQVLGALVPRSVRISEAPSHGETVMTYDPASTGAMSYRDAAREIAMRGASVPQPANRLGR